MDFGRGPEKRPPAIRQVSGAAPGDVRRVREMSNALSGRKGWLAWLTQGPDEKEYDRFEEKHSGSNGVMFEAEDGSAFLSMRKEDGAYVIDEFRCAAFNPAVAADLLRRAREHARDHEGLPVRVAVGERAEEMIWVLRGCGFRKSGEQDGKEVYADR